MRSSYSEPSQRVKGNHQAQRGPDAVTNNVYLNELSRGWRLDGQFAGPISKFFEKHIGDCR